MCLYTLEYYQGVLLLTWPRRLPADQKNIHTGVRNNNELRFESQEVNDSRSYTAQIQAWITLTSLNQEATELMGNARLCEGLKPVSVWWERNRPPRCADYPFWPPCPQEENKEPNYWNSRFLALPWFDRVILQPHERQLFAKIVRKTTTVSRISH